MDKNYLIVELGVEDGMDITRNAEGDAIQVSLPVVGEFDDKEEAEASLGQGEEIVIA